MKSYQLLFLSFVLIIASCKGQPKEIIITDPVVLLAKETSLYTDQIDWQEVNKKYTELADGKSSPEDLKPALQFLINSLGDKHGTIRSAKDNSILAYYTKPVDFPDKRDPAFVNDVINDITSEFSYDILDDDIGYLKIVGIGPNKSIEEHTSIIRSGLVDMYDRGCKSWIIDLRYNGGGNVNPMMAGTAPLIGEGFVGGSVDASGDIYTSYEIRQGQFFNGDRPVAPTKDEIVISSEAKVVVLLSRYTVSSGEMLAIAFKGRDNTLFIGEPSGGYVTGNGWNQIDDEYILNISNSIFIDRNKNVYKERVGVDEHSEFIPTNDLSSDLQIRQAIDWLKM